MLLMVRVSCFWVKCVRAACRCCAFVYCGRMCMYGCVQCVLYVESEMEMRENGNGVRGEEICMKHADRIKFDEIETRKNHGCDSTLPGACGMMSYDHNIYGRHPMCIVDSSVTRDVMYVPFMALISCFRMLFWPLFFFFFRGVFSCHTTHTTTIKRQETKKGVN